MTLTTTDSDLIMRPNVFVIVPLFTVIKGLAGLLVKATNFVLTHTPHLVFILGLLNKNS